MASSPPADQLPAASPNDEPSIEALATELRQLLRVGLDRAKPRSPSALLALDSVQTHARDAAYPDNADGLALALRDVIRSALDALGDGPHADAARLLWGAVPDTRGRTLAERRRIAADAIDLLPTTFRRRHEAGLLRDVAAEILRGDQRPPLAAVADPDEPDAGAVSPAQAVAVASLDNVRVLPVPRPHNVATAAVAAIVAVGIGLRFGLDLALGLVALLLLVALVVTIVGTMRLGASGLGPGPALLDQWPRLALLGVALVFVTGFLAERSDPGGSAPPEPCAGVVMDPACQPTTTAAPWSHASPNYVEPTVAELTPAAAPQCPPEQNTERRLVFTGVPPLCIDPDADYVASIATNFGAFQLDLNTADAPWTVNNFVYLARWRFYDGVTLTSTPRPHIDATSMVVGDPVAPEDADQAPGYTLTFEQTQLPAPADDFPATEPVYVVMTDVSRPQRWAAVISDIARAHVEAAPAAWPLLGQVRCGLDVIGDDPSPLGGFRPAYTSAPIVIDHITITEQPTPAESLHPERPCDQ